MSAALPSRRSGAEFGGPPRRAGAVVEVAVDQNAKGAARSNHRDDAGGASEAYAARTVEPGRILLKNDAQRRDDRPGADGKVNGDGNPHGARQGAGKREILLRLADELKARIAARDVVGRPRPPWGGRLEKSM